MVHDLESYGLKEYGREGKAHELSHAEKDEEAGSLSCLSRPRFVQDWPRTVRFLAVRQASRMSAGM
jgi:hypothetical protein